MAAVEIILAPTLHERLVTHLHGSDIEEVAFLAARRAVDSETIEAFDVLTLGSDDFAIQTDYHVRLTDEGRTRVIRWAHDQSAAHVEAHAHRSSSPAQFSPSDMWGLDDWVPHVRWRLPGRPYAALVFGDDSFDALAWMGESKDAGAVAGLRVAGRLHEPTGLTYQEIRSPRRQRDL